MTTKIIHFPRERTRAAIIDRSINYLEHLHRFAMANRAARRELFKPFSPVSGEPFGVADRLQ